MYSFSDNKPLLYIKTHFMLNFLTDIITIYFAGCGILMSIFNKLYLTHKNIHFTSLLYIYIAVKILCTVYQL